VGAFPRAQATKTRPAVVLSTEDYHRHRPDVVVGLITTSDWESVRVCFRAGFGGE
jgi:mRNA-degrading endonuclease toxin of MazEF toxin-antitoxin module